MSLNAQDTGDKQFRLGMHVSPEITFITLDKNSRGEETGTDFGYTISSNLEYFLSQKLSIETGLSYGNRKYKYLGIGLSSGGYIFASDIMHMFETGQAVRSSLMTTTKVSSLELPLQFKYYPFGKNFFLSAGGAFSKKLSFKSEGKIFLGTGEIQEISSIHFETKDVNFIGIVSLGYTAQIKEKVFVSFAPVLRMNSLKNQVSVYRTKGHLFSFGISLGLSYDLKQ